MKTNNQQSAHGRAARPAPPQHPTNSPTTKRVSKCVTCGAKIVATNTRGPVASYCRECLADKKREWNWQSNHNRGKRATISKPESKEPLTYAQIRRRARAVKVEGGWRGRPVAGGNVPAALVRGW